MAPSDERRPRRWSGPLIALIALGGLSLVLTWPLVAHFATHVPGDGIDDPSLAWNLWWIKHALVEQPQNPFQVAWQFWPVGINLAFYTLTVLNGLLAIPLQAAFGLIPAYNLLLLSSFVLGGFGAYLLCLEFLTTAGGGPRTRRERTNDQQPGANEHGPGDGRRFLSPSWPAMIGALLYAFASARLFYAALGQGNIASAQWIPFAALYILRAVRRGGQPRDAALAALFIVLQAYAELTYASFLGIFLALAVLWRTIVAWRERGGAPPAGARWSDMGALLARVALLAALCGIGLVPILANMLPDLVAEGDFFTAGGGFADIFSADLAGYLLPTQLHPLFGGLTRAIAHDSAPQPDRTHFPVNKGQHIYVGYVALVLAAIGLRRGRRRSDTPFFVAAALLFFVLTLGPSLRVAGRDLHVPLPFDLVARLPFYKGNRYPSRYSVMLLIALAPLVAAGVAHLTGRLVPHPRFRPGRRAVPAVLALLLIFEHLSIPLPLSDLRVPALYGRVTAAAGDFALLEMPPGWRNGARVAGKQDVVIMQQLWNQTAHGKRILGGNTSRNPEFKFQFFSEQPTLARLIALTNAADVPQHDALRAVLAAQPITPAEAALARDWAATWNIRYVMAHRDRMPAATETALRRLLPLELVAEEGPLALYRVAADLTPPDRFSFAAEAGAMVLAEGWSPPGLGGAVYAQRRETRLLLPLGPTARGLRFDLWAMAADTTMSVYVDGRFIGRAVLPTTRAWVTFELPAAASRPALSDVRLHFARLTAVADLAARDPAVGAAGPALPVSVVVRSAGQETGDFAHIYVNGVDVSPNRRGYNLVALDGADGHVLAAAAFDTHADPAASQRLAGWVRGLAPGTVVAAAVRDEASLNLGTDAVEALRSLGSTVDLRGHFRWGHALIGRTGAEPAEAQEQVSGWRVGQVAAGLPATAPEVAAALARVEIVK